MIQFLLSAAFNLDFSIVPRLCDRVFGFEL